MSADMESVNSMNSIGINDLNDSFLAHKAVLQYLMFHNQIISHRDLRCLLDKIHQALLKEFSQKTHADDSDEDGLSSNYPPSISSSISGRENISLFVSQCRVLLECVGLDITTWKPISHQASGDDDEETFYGLIDTISDETSKEATEYSKLELFYLKKLIEHLQETPLDGDDPSTSNPNSAQQSIGRVLAINIGGELPQPLKVSQADKLLDRFVADGWLEYRFKRESTDSGLNERNMRHPNFIVLGKRAVLELNFQQNV